MSSVENAFLARATWTYPKNTLAKFQSCTVQPLPKVKSLTKISIFS